MDDDMNYSVIVNAACARALASPMRWGVDDCCRWVAKIINDMTGMDLMVGIEPYSDRPSALLFIRKYAGSGLVLAARQMALTHDFPKVEAPFEGFLFGVLPGVDSPAIGILHHGKWLCRGESGVVVFRNNAASLAWRWL